MAIGLETVAEEQALKEKVRELASKRQAIILAHNYQLPEVQDIADFIGDSLELSRKAATAKKARMIIFCGVHFMAETAAILNPDKPVILPDLKAGCPLADMITAKEVKDLKKKHPGYPTVAYVNTSAAVKAEVSICCTSSNAVNVVNSLSSDAVIFIPDQYLASYVAKRTDKSIISWDGFCPTHARFTVDDMLKARKEFPDAIIVVHPECILEVQELADYVLSTGGMTRLPGEIDARQFVLGTEVGMVYRLQKLYPGRSFMPLNRKAICPNMKKITLEKVYKSLSNLAPVVKVKKGTRERALKAIERMLAIT